MNPTGHRHICPTNSAGSFTCRQNHYTRHTHRTNIRAQAITAVAADPRRDTLSLYEPRTCNFLDIQILLASFVLHTPTFSPQLGSGSMPYALAYSCRKRHVRDSLSTHIIFSQITDNCPLAKEGSPPDAAHSRTVCSIKGTALPCGTIVVRDHYRCLVLTREKKLPSNASMVTCMELVYVLQIGYYFTTRYELLYVVVTVFLLQNLSLFVECRSLLLSASKQSPSVSDAVDSLTLVGSLLFVKCRSKLRSSSP